MISAISLKRRQYFTIWTQRIITLQNESYNRNDLICMMVCCGFTIIIKLNKPTLYFIREKDYGKDHNNK